MYKKAFTLAEVLITLGIIGVVAAMTMPTLIQNHQKQVYATRFKKAVNVLENMPRKLMADEGVTNFSDTKLISEGLYMDCLLNYGDSNFCSPDGYANPSVLSSELTKAFNVVKTCKDSECNISYKDGYLNNNKYQVGSSFYLDNATWDLQNTTLIGLYMNDGSIFYFIPYGSGDAFLGFYIDVNGEKGPNQKGRDLFRGEIDLDGRVDFRRTDNMAYRIITNGWKMDY